MSFIVIVIIIVICAGNSPETREFPAQMASNAENISIWWRHHVMVCRQPGHYLNALSIEPLQTSFSGIWMRITRGECIWKWRLLNILPQCVVTDLCQIFFVLWLGIFHLLVPKKNSPVPHSHIFGVTRIKVEWILGDIRWVKTGEYVRIYNANNSQRQSKPVPTSGCFLLTSSAWEPSFWPYVGNCMP